MKLIIKLILFIFLFSHFLLFANFSFEFKDKIISNPTIYIDENNDTKVFYTFKYLDDNLKNYGFSSVSSNKEYNYLDRILDINNSEKNKILFFNNNYILKIKDTIDLKNSSFFSNFFPNIIEIYDSDNNITYSNINFNNYNLFSSSFFDVSKGKIIKYKDDLIIPLKLKNNIVEAKFNLNSKRINVNIIKNTSLNGENYSILNNNDKELFYFFKKSDTLSYYSSNSKHFKDNNFNEKIDDDSTIKTLLINDFDDRKIFIIVFKYNNKLKAISGYVNDKELKSLNSFELPFTSNDFDIEKNHNNDIVISYIDNNKLYFSTIPLSFFSKGINKKIDGIEKIYLENFYKNIMKNNLENININNNLKSDFNISYNIGVDLNKNIYNNILFKYLFQKYNNGKFGIEFDLSKSKNSFNINSYLVNKNQLKNDIVLQEKIGYMFSLLENNLVTDYLNLNSKIYNHNFLAQLEFEKKLNFNKNLNISPYLSYHLSIGKHSNSKIKNIYSQEVNIKNNINLSNNIILGTNIEYIINNRASLELFPTITFIHSYINSNLDIEDKIIKNNFNTKLNLNINGILNNNNNTIKLGINYSNDIHFKNHKFNFNIDYSFN